jgi:transcriptional regulator GlxA family with amidase domain
MARQVVIVGYDGAELLDISSVSSTFVIAQYLCDLEPGYQVRLASPGGRPVHCATGLVVGAQASLDRLTDRIDTLVVSGGLGFDDAAGDPRLVAHVRRLATISRRVASVCTGAGILAAAGLLDGRRATTHWQYAGRLAAEHPKVRFDPAPIFVRDGPVITSAGVTSALDLSLALIEDDHGPEVARKVSRYLVTYLQRPGNQAQMSMFTAPAAPESMIIRSLVDHIASHLDDDLGTSALANRAGISERQLARVFVRDLGQNPAQYVRGVRLEAAARLLSGGTTPVATVARRCGFGTAESLRQAFVARYGMPPSRYRAAFSPSIAGEPTSPSVSPGGPSPARSRRGSRPASGTAASASAAASRA